MYLANTISLTNPDTDPKKTIMVAVDIKFNQPVRPEDLIKISIQDLKVTLKSEIGNIIPAMIHCDRLEHVTISERDPQIRTFTYTAHIVSDELNANNIQKIRKLKRIYIKNNTDLKVIKITNFAIGTMPKRIKAKYLIKRSPDSIPTLSAFQYTEKRFEVKTIILHDMENKESKNKESKSEPNTQKKYHIQYTALPKVYEKAKVK